MRQKLITMAGVLALLAVLGRFYAQPVLAQVRAALVQSIDEPGRNPYQQNVLFNQSSCSEFSCVVNFTPVPAGFRLIVTHAAGIFSLENGGLLPQASLAINGDLFHNTVLLPAPVGIGFNEYIVSSPITYYVGPGNTPSLIFVGQFVTQREVTSSASIVGHLVSIP